MITDKLQSKQMGILSYQRWVLKQYSLVFMTHPFSFFSSPNNIEGEKNKRGWVIDTREFWLRTELRGILHEKKSRSAYTELQYQYNFV